jgi:hypothetical protein
MRRGGLAAGMPYRGCTQQRTEKEIKTMAKNKRVTETMQNAEKIVTVWKENPELTLGNLKYKDFDAIYTATNELIKNTLGREAELVGLKKQRDDQVRQLQDLVTRFRSVARAHFGLDSKEYAQVGGTPASARKPRTRKGEQDAKSEIVQAGA